MNPKRIAFTLSVLLCVAVTITAQENSRLTKFDFPEPRAKDGKKLVAKARGSG